MRCGRLVGGVCDVDVFVSARMSQLVGVVIFVGKGSMDRKSLCYGVVLCLPISVR